MRSKCIDSLWLTVLALTLGGVVARADMIIDGFTDAVNDRFTNDPGFIAASYDLSGIGKTSDRRWATLVSDNVFISANHWHPTVGMTLTFYATNDPSGGSITRTVAAGQRIGESDVWVGLLDEDVPAGYTPLAFITTSITSETAFNRSSLFLADIFMVGNSQTDPALGLDMALGANVLDRWLDSVTVGTTIDDCLLAGYNDSTDATYQDSEAKAQDQDSGAPMLQVVQGQLTVVGLNWFVGTAPVYLSRSSVATRGVTGFSYVGNYASQIQAVIDAYVGTSGAYRVWVGDSFAANTDLTETVPQADYDGNGLTNLEEYALGLDPTAPGDIELSTFDIAEAGASRYAQLNFTARADDTLSYQVEVSGDLAAWDVVDVTYAGGQWSTSNAAVAVVASQTDNGDGSWALVVRDATAITTSARFMRLDYP